MQGNLSFGLLTRLSDPQLIKGLITIPSQFFYNSASDMIAQKIMPGITELICLLIVLPGIQFFYGILIFIQPLFLLSCNIFRRFLLLFHYRCVFAHVTALLFQKLSLSVTVHSLWL